MKKKQTKDYYRLDNILSHPSSYYMIIGERSNGKTYAVKERMLYRHDDGKFLYVRRRHTHIVRGKMIKLFNDIEDVSQEIFGCPISYANESGFYLDKDGERETIGYAAAIEDAYDLKGIPYNDIKIILFDEFIDYNYMEKETEMFLHLISTVVRNRKDVEIFMLGNTISRYSPYFDLFHIDVKKLKQGCVASIHYNLGASIAIEYCKTRNELLGISSSKKHSYLGIDDNETVKMILYGEFETEKKNITNVDGIGWSSTRIRIPAYVTALGEVYELTLEKGVNPVLFVRHINTQQGQVRKGIRYNISFDFTVTLISDGKIVPTYSKISNLMDDEMVGMLTIAKECVRVGRVVYDTYLTGTEFEMIISRI